MASYGQYVDTLMQLGLSPNEAKVYLSTLKTGKTTVKIIAKIADIAREDVYRVLPSLQEKGLIKKYIGSPANYKSISPTEAMKVLLTQREDESEQLRNQADEFQLQCGNIENMDDNEGEKTFVVTRDNATGVDSELIRYVKKIKHSLDFTTRYKLYSYAFNESGLTEWINEMYYAANRGIKFRMIMNAPQKIKSICEQTFSVPNSKRLLMHPNFSFRYISKPPECILILFDNIASCIETACKKDHKMSPYMITNNSILTTLTKAYFKLLWNQALTEEQWKNSSLSRKREEQKHKKVNINLNSEVLEQARHVLRNP